MNRHAHYTHNSKIPSLMTHRKEFHPFIFIIVIISFITISFNVFGHAIDEQAAARKLISRLKEKDHKVWVNEGKRFIHANHLDSAMVCYSLVIQNSGQCRNKKEQEAYASGLNGMGVVYYLYGNYAQAYSMFLNAIKANPDCIDAYQNLAAVYWLFGKYDKSAEHLKEAYILQTDHGSLVNGVTAYINLLNIMLQNDMIQGADTIIAQFLESRPNAGEPLNRYADNLNKGITEILNGNTSNAIELFRKSTLPMEGLDPRLNVDMHINIAKVFEIRQELDSAIKYGRVALQTAQQEGYDDMAIKIGRYLADLLDKNGEQNEAKSIRYDALCLSDSLSNFTEYAKIINIDFENEIGQYKDEIEKKEHERNIHILLLWGLGTVSLLLLFTVLRMARQRKMLRLKDRKIFDSINADKGFPSMVSEISEASNVNAYPLPTEEQVFETGKKVEGSLSNEFSDNTKNLESNLCNETESGKEYHNKILPEREKNLTEAISKVMSDEKTYLSPDFSLGILAAIVGDTTKNVSQVINAKFGKNFYTLLNEKRIESAIRRMKDVAYDNYTIEAIADSLGFKSRSNFSKVFTSITGMSPSTFRKMCGHK